MDSRHVGNDHSVGASMPKQGGNAKELDAGTPVNSRVSVEVSAALKQLTSDDVFLKTDIIKYQEVKYSESVSVICSSRNATIKIADKTYNISNPDDLTQLKTVLDRAIGGKSFQETLDCKGIGTFTFDSGQELSISLTSSDQKSAAVDDPSPNKEYIGHLPLDDGDRRCNSVTGHEAMPDLKTRFNTELDNLFEILDKLKEKGLTKDFSVDFKAIDETGKETNRSITLVHNGKDGKVIRLHRKTLSLLSTQYTMDDLYDRLTNKYGDETIENLLTGLNSKFVEKLTKLKTKEMKAILAELPNPLTHELRAVFEGSSTVHQFLNDFSDGLTKVADKSKVKAHYKTLVNTMYQWQYEPITLEPVAEPLQTPFITNAQKTHYIGDIHGDLNHLLLTLTQSGLATIANPPIAFINVNTDQKVSFEDAQEMVGQDRDALLPIPNLIFNKDCKDEVIVLGDILDRGEYMDQCLHVLLDLARQEKDISPDSNKLKIVFGDHELYGFTMKVPFKPSYNLDPTRYGSEPNESSKIFGSNAPQHDINKTSASLNKAFQQGLIKYAWMGSHSECCTHSTFTETFIKNMKNTPITIPRIFKPVADNGGGVDSTRFIQVCDELLAGNNTNIAEFVDILNQTFVWLAKNINPDYYSKLLKHPMLQIIDSDRRDASNPIWSRAKGLRGGRDSDWLKVPGIIGHTDSEEGDIQRLTNDEGKDIIFDVDVGASEWYRFGEFSRARFITLNENCMLSHQSIVGKESKLPH